MITEQPIADLDAHRREFSGAQLEMVLASVRAGNTAARLWTGDGLALLWDQGNNVFYLARSGALHPEGTAHLDALNLRAAALDRGRRYFRARALAPELEPLLREILAPVALHPARKRFYRYDAPAPDVNAEPEGVAFVPIDGALLRTKGLANLEQVRSEIGFMWHDEKHFLAQGFGVAAVFDDAVVCWCTAEYVSRTMCGIGIETVEGCQNRGVATAAARRFVRHALSRGVTPHWECDAENLPSTRVAEKAGFTLLEESTFWAGLFDA
jgi:RimJ/RimL family protein N-acetyltransferase